MMRFTLKNTLFIFIVAVVLLTIFPKLGLGPYWTFILFLYFVYLAMANMWNLLAGYTGLVCLGQSSFIGIAGYTLGALTMMNISPYLGVLVGGLVAAALCLMIAVPILRMRGFFFAIGTLAVGEALRVFFTQFKPVMGVIWGGAGIPINAYVSVTELYYFAFILSLISIILLKLILISKLGLGFTAIRDNDVTSSCCGVPVFKCKLIAFTISAFMTGIVAGVFYLFQGHIEPSGAFGIRWTMELIIAVIIGGMGTLEGPIVGAAITVFLRQTLAGYIGLDLLIEGIILVVILLIMPHGIVGTARSILGLSARSYGKRQGKASRMSGGNPSNPQATKRPTLQPLKLSH